MTLPFSMPSILQALHLFLAVAVSAALIASSAVAGFDKDVAKTFCEAEWGNDFQMVVYCVNQQREGAEELDRLRQGLDDIMLERLAVCETEWRQDMQMQAYCLEQQISARQALPATTEGLPEDVAVIIQDFCAADWGTDFQMLYYCTEQQAKAWQQLNN
ncbi:MAG: hypothetical protein OXC26_21090 [Albidovulum sp.]|nr:hypothetical protein [Albidovulum sp.]